MLRWQIALLIAAAIAISYLDRQALPVAIQAIARDIPVTNEQFSQLQSAFLIAYAFMYVGGGKLMDVLGTRRGFTVIMLFWSLACASHGLAVSVSTLALSRFLLGAGEGGGFPAATRAVAEWFPVKERSTAMGIINAGTAAGMVVAPPLIALVLGALDWRWVFYLNLPLAAVVAGLIGSGLRETAVRATGRRLDLAGVASFVVGVTALLYACLAPRPGEGSDPGGLGPRLVALAVAMVALGLLVRIERRAPDPILAPALFRDPGFAASSTAAFFAGAAMFGALIHVPLMVQWGRGTDATTAGLTLMTMSGGWSAGGLVAGQVVNRVGVRPLTVGGMALMSLGYLALALWPQAPWRGLLWIGGTIGVGMGLAAVTLILLVQTRSAPERRGMATAAILFFRSVGATMGVAVMGAVLTARLGAGLDRLEAGAGTVSPALAAAVTREIGLTFWLGATAAVLGLVAISFTPGGSLAKEGLP
jgi:MFS family permease